MKKLTFALVLGALAMPGMASAQAIFSATGAVINAGGPGDGDIAQTYNQAGLLTGYTADVTDFDTYIAGDPIHDYVFSGNEWFSNAGSNAATVTYDLGSVRSFDRFALWNEDISGLSNVTLLISSDNVNFTSFLTFSPTNNADNVNYGAEVFSFGVQTGRYVRLAATDCPQAPGNYTACAIGEVAFRSARGGGVPEPATWAMMIGGFGMAGAAMRRRRVTAAIA